MKRLITLFVVICILLMFCVSLPVLAEVAEENTSAIEVIGNSYNEDKALVCNESSYESYDFKGTEYDGIYYMENEDGNMVVEGSYSGEIIIPPYVDGKKVVSVAENAFYKSQLYMIVLPYTLTSVGTNAFFGCELLYDVNYVGSLQDWEKVSVGSGNEILTDNLKADYSNVFDMWQYGYYENGYFVMNFDITTLLVEAEAYLEIYEINNMTGELIKLIHSGYYDIPIGVSSCKINLCPFEADNKQYTIKGKIVSKNDRSKVYKEILSNGFFTAERERYTEGDWEYYCYDGISEIASYLGNGEECLVIPSSLGGCPVKRIGDWSLCTWFETPVKEIVIPDEVTYIGEGAFAIESLEKAFIPAKVEEIGSFVFDGCFNLKEINVSEDNKNYKSIDGNLYTKDEKILILYAPGKNDNVFSVREGTETLSMGAFASNFALEVVELPKSLLEIGEYAFTGCQNLKTISFPLEGCKLKTIGYSAFGSSGIEEINIPASVELIGKEAFRWCKMLSSINVSDDNSYYCSIDGNLYSKDEKELLIWVSEKDGHIELPEGIEIIAEYSLSFLQAETLYIPKSVKSITDPFMNSEIGCILYSGSEDEWMNLWESYMNYGYNIMFNSSRRNFVSVNNYNSYYENDKVTMHMRWVNILDESMAIMAVYDRYGNLVSVSRADITDNMYDMKLTSGADESCIGGTVKVFFRKIDDYLMSYGKVISDVITEPVIESIHYVKDANDVHTYEYDGECESISLTFSEDTHMEEYYYICINAPGESSKYYTTDELSGVTIVIPGNQFEISMRGDPDGLSYGYKIEKIVVNK